VYRVSGATVHATLYSIGDVNVSVIAAEFGGGGHRNAAGFTMPLKDWVTKFH
jgi:nanoRNase/pAp phosphatase (c-di-AMP/oligoRNAs hydrolase)